MTNRLIHHGHRAAPVIEKPIFQHLGIDLADEIEMLTRDFEKVGHYPLDLY